MALKKSKKKIERERQMLKKDKKYGAWIWEVPCLVIVLLGIHSLVDMGHPDAKLEYWIGTVLVVSCYIGVLVDRILTTRT